MSERKPVSGDRQIDESPNPRRLGRREAIKVLARSGGVLATAMTLPASWSPAVVEVLARGTTTPAPTTTPTPTTTTPAPTTTPVPPTTTPAPPTTPSPTTSPVPVELQRFVIE